MESEQPELRTVGERLKHARTHARGRIRQADAARIVSEALGTQYSRSAYSMWEIGSSKPPQRVLEVLANAFEVDLDWLSGGIHGRLAKEARAEYGYEPIPYLGALPCGPWAEGAPERTTIPIRRGMGGRNRFAFRVAGSSMAPRLNDGDYVVGEYTEGASPGELVIAQADDGSLTVKRLAVLQGGRYALSSLQGDKVEPKPARVIGRVLFIVPEGAVPAALLSSG